LLYSFGAIMTVCEVQRHDALKRVLAVAMGGKDQSRRRDAIGRAAPQRSGSGKKREQRKVQS
jgi:hypothetical protein